MPKRKANDMDLWVLQNLYPQPNLVADDHPNEPEMCIAEVTYEEDSIVALRERIIKLEKENQSLKLTKDNINKDNTTLRKLLAKLMETI